MAFLLEIYIFTVGVTLCKLKKKGMVVKTKE